MRAVMAAEGKLWRVRTLEEYLGEMANTSIWNYTGDECEEITRRGVMGTFGLNAEEVERYFINHCDVYRDENRFGRLSFTGK